MSKSPGDFWDSQTDDLRLELELSVRSISTICSTTCDRVDLSSRGANAMSGEAVERCERRV
jgi:hypothetical protein